MGSVQLYFHVFIEKFQRGASYFTMRVFGKRISILTQFAFLWKIQYLCNRESGLSTEKSRFFHIFKALSRHFLPYYFLKFPVSQLKLLFFNTSKCCGKLNMLIPKRTKRSYMPSTQTNNY